MLKKFLIVLMALAVLGCSAETSANLDKAKQLKEGMTESEITAIMGTPSEKKETDMMGNKMTVLHYADGEPKITVFVVDGKAQSAAAGKEALFGKVSTPGN